MKKQSDYINKRLSDLPKGPGVYFHKDAAGTIIYIGKAARLNSRVRHYFQKSRFKDPKTDALVAEIAEIDWTETETELDALFLEAELIRRYRPKYNILLRDDKSLTYVRISYKAEHPTVTLTRRPLDDGAHYFGPYFSAVTVRRALKLLRKAFPYSTHVTSVPKRACLHVHLGLCPGLEVGATSLADYRSNLKKLMRYLRGERTALMRQLEADMKQAAKEHKFELAAQLRNKLRVLEQLGAHIVFSDKESLDISKDMGLVGLAELLGLTVLPDRIEGYDISHMQGSDTVASMVVFQSGMPDKASYRKFKMRVPGNDDFIHMHEVIRRRFASSKQRSWGRPDICLIDGGKGQLSAAIKARDEREQSIPMIGLAKRFEQLVIHKTGSLVELQPDIAERQGGYIEDKGDYYVVSLPPRSDIVKLLQRIRDESHRFAVSYHTVLKRHRTTASRLDDIAGVGPATKKKLLKTFGSLRAITAADQSELAEVIGTKKASLVYAQLHGPANNKPTRQM